MVNPVIGFVRTCLMLLGKRIRFDDDAVGKRLVMADGKAFTAFRRAVVEAPDSPEPAAYFIVRFKPMDMTIEENIRFSKKAMLIFMGFTGFRSKYWAVDYGTGLCQGLYEWQTVADAVAYSGSMAMAFMRKRSDPASVEFFISEKGKDDTATYRVE